jgi:16S rRNA (guanine527-N7)-methyltransferase
LPDAHPEVFGPAELQAASGVSRETLARLKLFVSLLEDWNARINLVSARSLAEVWKRHIWDSVQLYPFIPTEARTLIDLGSGAGFPGLVLAILLAERGGARVVLCEAITKKCRFLEEAAHRTGVVVEIRNDRIEAAKREPFDIVTARACAPLAQLLSYAALFQGKNTHCLFLKGQSVGVELSEAHKSWSMKVEQHQSRSDLSGIILDIRELQHG